MLNDVGHRGQPNEMQIQDEEEDESQNQADEEQILRGGQNIEDEE